MNPRQVVLRSFDVYRLLGELLADEEGVVIDGGANVGEATKALRRHFPDDVIHAFEPVAGPFERLAEVCAAQGAHAHKAAIGREPGTAEINVNRNLWTSSLLDANERGHAFHADWCETVSTETVDVVRLDAWAEREGVRAIKVLKLDLQGFEMPALYGTGELLDKVCAVYSEAQITPEYEGASTFSEIDAMLSSRGFGLYQIVDLCLKGDHLEPSCCDGLWLRADVLARVRSGQTPRTIAEAGDLPGPRMSEALDLCAKVRLDTVALYGAGAHTVSAGAALASAKVDVACVIDDGRSGGTLWGYPIVSPEEAMAFGIRGVIVSSDSVEDLLVSRCGRYLAAGVPVIRLYGPSGVEIIRPHEQAAASESV